MRYSSPAGPARSPVKADSIPAEAPEASAPGSVRSITVTREPATASS